MKNFHVFKHPTLGYQAVKQGFSWPAFFFNWIWAFVKRMWGEGFVFLGVNIVLTLIEKLFEREGSNAGILIILFAQIGFFIFIGVKANEWRRNELTKRGFKLISLQVAETPDAAIALAANTLEGDHQNKVK